MTVPCVTNLRRGSARFGPDMTSDSPVKKKNESHCLILPRKKVCNRIVFYLHLEG